MMTNSVGIDPTDANLLADLRHLKHEQPDEMVEWVGEDFDPEAFDLAVAKVLGRRGI